MYVWTYEHMYIVCLYACMYARIRCVCICMYICMYTHTLQPVQAHDMHVYICTHTSEFATPDTGRPSTASSTSLKRILSVPPPCCNFFVCACM